VYEAQQNSGDWINPVPAIYVHSVGDVNGDSFDEIGVTRFSKRQETIDLIDVHNSKILRSISGNGKMFPAGDINNDGFNNVYMTYYGSVALLNTSYKVKILSPSSGEKLNEEFQLSWISPEKEVMIYSGSSDKHMKLFGYYTGTDTDMFLSPGQFKILVAVMDEFNSMVYDSITVSIMSNQMINILNVLVILVFVIPIVLQVFVRTKKRIKKKHISEIVKGGD